MFSEHHHCRLKWYSLSKWEGRASGRIVVCVRYGDGEAIMLEKKFVMGKQWGELNREERYESVMIKEESIQIEGQRESVEESKVVEVRWWWWKIRGKPTKQKRYDNCEICGKYKIDRSLKMAVMDKWMGLAALVIIFATFRYGCLRIKCKWCSDARK